MLALNRILLGMKLVQAVSSVSIRLTSERIMHIEFRHPEMKDESERLLETVSAPDLIQEGDNETLIAVRHYDKTPMTKKYCVVVYREQYDVDGFIITAYFASEIADWRKILWKR